MTRSHAVHVRLYRWWLELTPAAHRDRHGEDQIRLFADLIANGHQPWRLWAGAVPDLLNVLRTHERRTVMSHLARTALYPLSAINTLAGLALAVMAASTDAVPVWVAIPAAAVATQGLYSLLWLRRRLPASPRAANSLFAVGESLALAAGVVGVAAAIISQSSGSDPEYGPPTMMALVAVRAIVGLLASPPSPTTEVQAAP